MPPDELSSKVNDFLAHEVGDEARAQALAFIDDMIPGILTMLGGVPSNMRREAIVVVADTRHEPAASITRAVLRHVPSGASKMSQVGVDVLYFAQPRATVETLFRAYEVPIPREWAHLPEPGAVRMVLLLNSQMIATDFMAPSSGAEVGRA